MESNQDAKVQQGKKDCCKDECNLYIAEQRKIKSNTGAENDLVVRKCKVCGCRHIELSVDPGQFGLTGAKVG